MAKGTIRVEGLDAVLRNLAEFKKALPAEVKSANLDAANLVAVTARVKVPRRSGDLERTIRASGTARSGVVRAGFARVPYAGPIHFGWPERGIEPQPFLYEALDANATNIVRIYEKRVAELTAKADG